jgi:hypothetical protein
MGLLAKAAIGVPVVSRSARHPCYARTMPGCPIKRVRRKQPSATLRTRPRHRLSATSIPTAFASFPCRQGRFAKGQRAEPRFVGNSTISTKGLVSQWGGCVRPPAGKTFSLTAEWQGNRTLNTGKLRLRRVPDDTLGSRRTGAWAHLSLACREDRAKIATDPT